MQLALIYFWNKLWGFKIRSSSTSNFKFHNCIYILYHLGTFCTEVTPFLLCQPYSSKQSAQSRGRVLRIYEGVDLGLGLRLKLGKGKTVWTFLPERTKYYTMLRFDEILSVNLANFDLLENKCCTDILGLNAIFFWERT